MISHYYIKSMSVDIISWNRQLFFFYSLSSLTKTTIRKINFGYFSENILPVKSAANAQFFGIETIDKTRNPQQAIGSLMCYNSPSYTLLTNSIKQFYDSYWLLFAMDKIFSLVVTILPEIIRCGVTLRHFDLNMPRKLFMFYKTALIKKSSNIAMLSNSDRLLPHIEFVVNGLNVTHILSATLSDHRF